GRSARPNDLRARDGRGEGGWRPGSRRTWCTWRQSTARSRGPIARKRPRLDQAPSGMGCPRYAARPATPERRVTLQEPPKQKKAAGPAGRFIGLILLLAASAVVVWTTAPTQQSGALERSDPFVHAPGEHLSLGNVII